MSDELFSYRLRRFREKNGLSLDAMGKALGITGRYVGMIERGDKDVEPSSSLYKLFSLMEANRVPLREVEKDDLDSAREEPTAYNPGLKTPAGLTMGDCIAQIFADLEVIQKGTAEESRRAFAFLQDVHMPLLGSLLRPAKRH